MRRAVCLLGFVLGVVGCMTTNEERLRDYNNDGVYLFGRGDYSSARESFLAALKLSPEDPALLYNIGQCYDRQGALGQAQQYYNECLGLDPKHVPCRFALAGVMVRDGRLSEATQMGQDWLAREPKSADAFALDGWLWGQSGDLPRAQKCLEKALELDAHNDRALIELALIYEKLNRPERAVVLYERILEREPHRPDVVDRLNRLVSKGATRPQPD